MTADTPAPRPETTVCYQTETLLAITFGQIVAAEVVMALPETDRKRVETLLRYGFSDEQVKRRTGASLLEILESRAEASVRPAYRVLDATTGERILPDARRPAPGRGRGSV